MIKELKVLMVTEDMFTPDGRPILGQEVDMILMPETLKVKFFYMTEFKHLREALVPMLKPGGMILSYPVTRDLPIA